MVIRRGGQGEGSSLTIPSIGSTTLYTIRQKEEKFLKLEEKLEDYPCPDLLENSDKI